MPENTVYFQFSPKTHTMTRSVSFVFLFALLLVPAVQKAGHAAEQVKGFRSTELPLPRFVSIRADKAYVRAGPALRYPIKWVFKKEDLPVEIVQEFDHWRKIRDSDGEEGWVHKSLLSGVRTVMISHEDLVPMREGFSHDSRLVARLEPRVIAELESCSDEWCRVRAEGYRGWIERKFLWGIYADEQIN